MQAALSALWDYAVHKLSRQEWRVALSPSPSAASGDGKTERLVWHKRANLMLDNEFRPAYAEFLKNDRLQKAEPIIS